MAEKQKIVVISGPSGSGKNSVLEGILEKCDNCTRLVTATTRSRREGEEHGVDYYFLSKEEFIKGTKNGEIPEYWHAIDTDRYYGTYIPDLEKKIGEGKTVLAQLQIEGVRFFKRTYDALSIFIMPESLTELQRRVLGRQDMSEKELKERLQEAEKEIIEYSPEYDHRIVNKKDQLDSAVEDVLDILRKEQYL